MDPSLFSDSSPGRLVPVRGVAGISHAFVPDPLPLKWEWPASLWQLLLEAREALARLDGAGKHLPNPELILRPLQFREAQKSSNLEGTFTDPHQQILFDIDPKMPRSSDDPANAMREVFNYSRALRHHRESDLALSLRLVRQLHEVLMDGVRGSDRSPGRFRSAQNQIGRPPRYVPPPANLLSDLLGDFEGYLHSERDYDPLVAAFLAHYQFDAIHPFLDGNGRVGRLLLAITIPRWCGMSKEWLYMSEYFDRNRDQYIDRLFAVSTRADWTGWLEFCLVGVREQATLTENRCERLIQVNRGFHERIHAARGSVRLSALVDQLFINPVITVTLVRNTMEISYPTARDDLRRLEEMGIIQEVPDTSRITYYCPTIFEVAYGD